MHFNFCLFTKMRLFNKNAFVTTAVFSSLPSYVLSIVHTYLSRYGHDSSIHRLSDTNCAPTSDRGGSDVMRLSSVKDSLSLNLPGNWQNCRSIQTLSLSHCNQRQDYEFVKYEKKKTSDLFYYMYNAEKYNENGQDKGAIMLTWDFQCLLKHNKAL